MADNSISMKDVGIDVILTQHYHPSDLRKQAILGNLHNRLLNEKYGISEDEERNIQQGTLLDDKLQQKLEQKLQYKIKLLDKAYNIIMEDLNEMAESDFKPMDQLYSYFD